MGKYTTHFWSLVCLAVLLVLSCDAPHKNPLDPENQQTGYAVLTGYTRDAKKYPLENVQVIWSRENRIAFTDKNGYFEFENLFPDSGWAFFKKDGYLTDSTLVKLSRNNIVSKEVFLYTSLGLSGYVKEDDSEEPLADVLVSWRNSVFTKTNVNGFYQFLDLKRQDGWLYFQKQNYLPDSVFVEWQDNIAISKDVRLDTCVHKILYGQVQAQYGASEPISDVKVTWEPANQYCFTDANGNFAFYDIPFENGLLFLERDGYLSDTLEIELGDVQRPMQKNVHLFSKPSLQNFQIYSITEYEFAERFKFFIYMGANLIDPDRNIDIVTADCPDLGLHNLPLEYRYNESNPWSNSFTSADLTDISDLRELVGHEFVLKVKLKSKQSLTLCNAGIKRIIQDVIEPKFPILKETVDSQPTFEWKAFNPGYNFSYILQIFNNEANPEVVEEFYFSSQADSFKYTLPNSLADNPYQWAIWCVDDFGNRARSAIVSFTVESDDE